jgi:nicotinamide mononucleotide adenylyltransferase
MRKVAIAGGRFNPPTRGHEALIQQLLDLAHAMGVPAEVFVVDGAQSSQDKLKNPLTVDQRLAILRQWFPAVRFDVVGGAYDIMEVLEVQNKQPVVWLAGSDRVRKYQSLLLREGHAESRVVEVNRSAGQAEGVSATQARHAARQDDLPGFRAMMPLHVSASQLEHIMGLIKQAEQHGHTGTTGPHRLLSS